MSADTSTRAAWAGTLLGGKYRLVHLLGRGAFGQVYEAEHVDVGRRYAIKLLNRGLDATRSRQRFAQEARALARLEHENIVGLIDLGEDATVGDYLVLEFIRGSTLRTALPGLKLEAPLRTLSVARQIAQGLAHAHATGVVHRDLKPENVMLTSHADGRLLVKVLDFGIARLFDSDKEFLTTSGTTLGTAAYMAPEQARGDRDVDNRVDLYALGVILYEALSGARPFEGASYNETLFHILTKPHVPLAELRPDLPRAVTELVERALMRDRADRFATADAFAAALAEAERTLRPPSLDLETLDLATGERPPAPPLPRELGPSHGARRAGSTPRRWLAVCLLVVGGLGFTLGSEFQKLRLPSASHNELNSGDLGTERAPKIEPPGEADTVAPSQQLNGERVVTGNAALSPPSGPSPTLGPGSTTSVPAQPSKALPTPARNDRPPVTVPKDRGF